MSEELKPCPFCGVKQKSLLAKKAFILSFLAQLIIADLCDTVLTMVIQTNTPHKDLQRHGTGG